MNLNLDKSTWKRVALGGVALASKEKVNPSDGTVERFVAGEHMDTNDLKIHRWGDPSEIDLGPAFHRRFRPGQVLYGSRRTYLRKIAVADFDGVCANTTFVVETRDDDTMLQEFLPFVMSSEPFHAFAIAESKGSVNPYVNWSDIERYQFDLPPLDEQKRIADLLWSVEGDRRTTLSLLVAVEDLREEVVEARFVGDGTHTLEELCDRGGIRIGPFGAQLHAFDYVDDGDCPVVMPQDMVDGGVSTQQIKRITEERARDLATHRLQPGDVILPRRGELNRRALITENEAGWLCGTGSVRVRVREGVPARAVLLALSSRSTVEWLNANATGTTMPNLNAGIVARIPISLPGGVKLIEALREIDRIDNAVPAIASRTHWTTQLRTSLLAQIFGDA